MGGRHETSIQRFRRLERAMGRLAPRLRAATIEAQRTCPHPVESIFEIDYRSSVLGTTAPWRVCAECGFAEEGWGCGYKYLATPNSRRVPTIDRERGLELRRGKIHSNTRVTDAKWGRIAFEELYR